MTALPILKMGNPVLKTPADPVSDPKSPEIRALLADMIDSMREAGGVGLAAPQIGESLRVVIFEVPAERTQDGVGLPLGALINPVITPLTDETVEAYEGCLSVPGMTGRVPRYTRIAYSGYDQDGNRIEREAEGFHARVVQHECDHLDGILYPQRMTDMSTFGFVDEIRKRVSEPVEAD